MKKKKLLGIIICAFFVIGAIGSCSNDENKSPANGTAQTEQKKSKEQIMYDKFLALQMGSSYDNVKAALGVEGQLSHENDVAGIKTQAYNWKDGDATITTMFQNGELTTKSMASLSFLKSNGDEIKMVQFNNVQIGMTYDQVKQALNNRDGYLMSEAQFMGSSSQIYSWINNGGSNVQVTFTDGAVDSKTQFGLK